MWNPYVVALCPTKGRPKLIPNVLAMWNAQTYPTDRRELLIFDDQPNFPSCSGDNWQLVSTGQYDHISEKYEDMVEYAIEVYNPDLLVVWEDDDIYLPTHISNAAAMQILGHDVTRNSLIWTNHPGGFGKARLYTANAPYHGSWSFTPEAYRNAGGYISSDEERRSYRTIGSYNGIGFDANFCSRLSNTCVNLCQSPFVRLPGIMGYVDIAVFPTYVYRFGTTGYANASGIGLDFQARYNAAHSDIDMYPRPEPEFDEETQLLMNLPSGRIPEEIASDPESVTDGLLIEVA